MLHLAQNMSREGRKGAIWRVPTNHALQPTAFTLYLLTMNSPNPVWSLPTRPVFKTSSGCPLHKSSTCYDNKRCLSLVLHRASTSFIRGPVILVWQGFCQQDFCLGRTHQLQDFATLNHIAPLSLSPPQSSFLSDPAPHMAGTPTPDRGLPLSVGSLLSGTNTAPS